MYIDRDSMFVVFEGERDRRMVILTRNCDITDVIEQFRRQFGRLPTVNSCFELSDDEFYHLLDNQLYDVVFDLIGE